MLLRWEAMESVAANLVNQATNHVFETYRFTRQSKAADRQARMMHQLRTHEERRLARRRRNDDRDLQERRHRDRIEEIHEESRARRIEAAEQSRYRKAEADRQHRHAVALEVYRLQLRQRAEADARELANSPFHWTSTELYDRVAANTLDGRRPLLLVAPFRTEQRADGRIDQDRQRFRHIIGRTWRSRPWNSDLGLFEGALTRPLDFDDDDILTVQRALGDLPVVLIHGRMHAGRSLDLRITAWNLFEDHNSGALAVTFPEMKAPVEGDAVADFHTDVGALCATVAGVYADWFHLLRYGRTPELQRHLPVTTAGLGRVIAAASAALVPASDRNRPLDEASVLLSQATVLAEAGLAEQADITLTQLRALTPVPAYDPAAEASLIRRLVAAIPHTGGGYRLRNRKALTAMPWRSKVKANKPVRVHARQPSRVQTLAVSPDSRLLATGDAGGRVKLWDLLTGAHVRTLGSGKAHTEDVTAVAFSPDGLLLASGGNDGVAKVWRVVTGDRLWRIDKDQWIEGVAFSPDSRLLALGVDDRVRVFDLIRRKQVRNRLCSDEGINDVAFSPDGQLLAAADLNGSVHFWKVSTGKGAGWHSHGECAYAVAFSPDGRLVATAGDGDDARVRTVATRKRSGRAMRHDDEVNDISFSPDSAMIATASDDRTVRLWQAEDGIRLRTIKHPTAVDAVAFAYDGRILVTAAGKRVRLWRL